MPSNLYSLLLPASNSKSSYVSFICPFLWYLVLAEIRKKHCESSFSLAIWACKLVCLPGVTLKKDQETWLSACNFAWFWGTYHSARLCCLKRSFVAWHLYNGLAFEVFGHGEDSAGTWPSTFGAWRIILLQFSILNRDQGFPHRKCKDNIYNWAWKVCSRCWYFWH